MMRKTNRYVVLFEKNNCPLCVTLKAQMEQAGIDFEEINISHNIKERDILISKGFRSLPQVFKDDGEYLGDARKFANLYLS